MNLGGVNLDTATKRLYEGLFLVDTAIANSNWDGISTEIKGIIEKRGGEVVDLKKWDERKLAYEIDNKTRATYILVYFNCVTDGLAKIERDINLSENIMRAMLLRADGFGEEHIKKETPLEAQQRADQEVKDAQTDEATDASAEDTSDDTELVEENSEEVTTQEE